MRPSCELTRYAFLLRSDEVLEKKFGKSTWTKPMIAGANLILGIRRLNHVPGFDIRLLEGRFDDEFDHLDRMVLSAGIIRASRSAEFLNWRFRERPGPPVQVLVARQRGELVAFLAFFIYRGKRALICDLFGHKVQEAGRALVAAAVELCRKKGVACLEGYCAQNSEHRSLFEAAGFRARERAARVVAYTRSGESSAGMVSSSNCWTVGQAELNS
jgi:hypothetical protein